MSPVFNDAVLLYRKKHYYDALELFLSLDEDPEEDILLAYYLGLCYTKIENYDEALLYFRIILDCEDDLIILYQVRMLVVYIYTVLKDYLSAERDLQEMLKSGVKSPQVYSALAYAQYAEGKVEKSIETLYHGLDMDPDNANILNSLGYILADADVDFIRALRFCRRAMERDKNNPAYLDSLGWAYFKSGKFDDAELYLRQALALLGNHELVGKHLDAVLAKLGG